MPEQVTATFKLDKDMAEWVQKTAFDLDIPKSELIRCCLLLSIDTIRATPSLVNRIQFKDRMQ